MKLVIDRNVWLRGADAKNGHNSYLLRPTDGKRCCVGIYLSALGFSDVELSGLGEDAELRVPVNTDDECDWDEDETEIDPRVPVWLRAESLVYGINDDADTPEDERERLIAERFKRGGVDVEFTG